MWEATNASATENRTNAERVGIIVPNPAIVSANDESLIKILSEFPRERREAVFLFLFDGASRLKRVTKERSIASYLASELLAEHAEHSDHGGQNGDRQQASSRD